MTMSSSRTTGTGMSGGAGIYSPLLGGDSMSKSDNMSGGDGMSGGDDRMAAFLDNVVLVESGWECDYFCHLEDDCIAAAFRDGVCRLYRHGQLTVTQETGTTLFVKGSEGMSHITQLWKNVSLVQGYRKPIFCRFRPIYSL